MVAMITDSWLSPWCVGNIKGSWLCNSKTANRIPSSVSLIEEGDITETYVGELATYSGFGESEYFRLSHSSDITIPDTDWSFMWHQKVSVTGDRQTIFEIASNTYEDNYLSMSIEEDGTAKFVYNVDENEITIRSNAKIAIDRWTHCILSRRGYWITLQMNGVTIFSVNLTNNTNFNPNVTIVGNGLSLIHI